MNLEKMLEMAKLPKTGGTSRDYARLRLSIAGLDPDKYSAAGRETGRMTHPVTC